MKKKLLGLLIASLFAITLVTGCGEQPKVDTDPFVTAVHLNVNLLSLEIGQSANLSAEISVKEGKEYLGNIDWKTSNPHIVNVNQNGDIVALAAGRAYISAIVGYKADSCAVDVVSPFKPVSDEYLISDSVLTIRPQATHQLYTSFNGSSVVSTFTSDNTNVATVSESGLVTGVQNGKATITATYLEHTVTCSVTVDSSAPEEFVITVAPLSATLVEGGEITLTAETSKPTTVTWTSDNPSVATVDENGNVKAIKEGTASITALSEEYAKQAKSIITVKKGEDDDKNVTIYFFLDYNNVDPDDTSGKKLLAEFKWYQNVPLKDAPIPPTPTEPSDPAFPVFMGWSDHTIIDQKEDLWDMNTDVVSGSYHLYLYGIWTDK